MIILLGLNALVYLKTIVECIVFKLHLIESSLDMYTESLGSIVPFLLLKLFSLIIYQVLDFFGVYVEDN